MRTPAAIIQTREVVVALATAFATWQQANADAKVTWAEWAGFVTLAPVMWKAVKNAGEIPNELNDLDEAEADDLIRAVSRTINAQIDTPSMRRKIDKLLILFHATIDAQAEWRGVNPLRAEIVR